MPQASSLRRPDQLSFVVAAAPAAVATAGSMTPEALPFILLQGLLFGTTLVVSRFAVSQFQPATYVALRLALATLGYAVIFALSSLRWPRGQRLWGHSAVLGIFGTALPMLAVVTSLQFQSSGVTALLITAGPALTILLAHFALHDEPLTRRTSVGIALALSGAALLALRGESGLPDVAKASPIGYGLVLAAMFSASGSTVYARRYMRDLDSIDVGSARMLVAALLVAPLAALFAGYDLSHVERSGFVALIYAALVGTFAGMLLAFFIIKEFGATASAVTAYVIPVVASIGGIVFLGETFSAGMLAGMMLIIAGIATLNRRVVVPPDVSEI